MNIADLCGFWSSGRLFFISIEKVYGLWKIAYVYYKIISIYIKKLHVLINIIFIDICYIYLLY